MRDAIRVAEILLGLGVLAVTFYDLFQSVVLPRPSIRKVQLARTVIRPMWRLWKFLLNRGSQIDRSEARLAAFGPIALLTLFLIWGLALITGYALVIDGMADQ